MSFFPKKKKKEGFSRESSLLAIPIHNNEIREENTKNGLKISFYRDAPLFGAIIARFNLPQAEKTIILDNIGAYVWNQIDGKKTTHTLINEFSVKFKIGKREAEISVVEFIKMLMTRGAVSLIFNKK